jgi:drug/metabolite transporter (DMT)-like permease
MALASAFLWAVASLVWGHLNKKQISPVAINLGKTILACFCFVAAALFIRSDAIDSKNYFFLFLSGLLGISIGDTSFFYSLKYLGPRISVLLAAFIPIATVLLAFLFLHESLSFFQWLGILACIYGIVVVLKERNPCAGQIIDKKRGIIWALVSVISCSVSVLISKTVLTTVGAFAASVVRLEAGAIGLLIYCVFNRQCFSNAKCLFKPGLLGWLFLGSFLGTFLGIWFSLAALKYTLASVATVLNATSPIFILPLAYWFLKEKISPKTLWATIVTVIGVALVLVF